MAAKCVGRSARGQGLVAGRARGGVWVPPRIDYARCNHCSICDRHCPTDVFTTVGRPPRVVVQHPEQCWHCGVCRLDCQLDAITISLPLVAIYG